MLLFVLAGLGLGLGLADADYGAALAIIFPYCALCGFVNLGLVYLLLTWPLRTLTVGSIPLNRPCCISGGIYLKCYHCA